jgi:hypothetical protein
MVADATAAEKPQGRDGSPRDDRRLAADAAGGSDRFNPANGVAPP